MTEPTLAVIARDNLFKNNPVTVQVLGICSTLAVTNVFLNTLIMGLGLSFATAFSGLTLSLMRNIIPQRIRMMVQVLIISTYVILIDIALKAYVPAVSRALGPYVGLIITNCIVMGRMEAFASSHRPIPSFWDGLFSGFGYSWVLLVIAFVRELLGFGSILGIAVMDPLMHSVGCSEGWIQWSFMIMAPGGFFMLALFIWVVKSLPGGKSNGSRA